MIKEYITKYTKLHFLYKLHWLHKIYLWNIKTEKKKSTKPALARYGKAEQGEEEGVQLT